MTSYYFRQLEPIVDRCSCRCNEHAKYNRPLSSPALGSLTAVWVRSCMMNFTGSTSPTDCFSSWQWLFTDVWTAVHHHTCRSTASRSLVLTLGAICVPPAVNYTCSTSLPAQHLGPSDLYSCCPQSELSPEFYPGSDHQCRLFQTLTYCSLDTSAFNALEVLDDNRAT